MDRFEIGYPSPKRPLQTLSVSELTKCIKNVLESNFSDVWVTGEISGVKYYGANIYFDLKDSQAKIHAVIWSEVAKTIKFKLKDGLQVIIRGSVRIYTKEGRYQLRVQYIEPEGMGPLELAFAQLKEEFEKKGLFDKTRKRPIPLPQTLCIVTSPEGAALYDMLRVLKSRCRFVNVMIYPVKVQGEGAALEIANAIKDINRYLSKEVDVIIVGRGGGSREDLWAFNEPEVAWAIYNSKIPVISAVGHEVDVSLSDLVADARAMTPTDAANKIAKIVQDIEEKLHSYLAETQKDIREKVLITKTRLIEWFIGTEKDVNEKLLVAKSNLSSVVKGYAIRVPEVLIVRRYQDIFNLGDKLRSAVKLYAKGIVHNVVSSKQTLKNAFLNLQSAKFDEIALTKQRLSPNIPLAIIKQRAGHLEQLAKRLQIAIHSILGQKKQLAGALDNMLDAVNPLSILKRGYSITKDVKSDKIIKTTSKVKIGDKIKTLVSDGELISEVTQIKPKLPF
jgi:exodeoxyribonuclease VII large subunit